MGYEMLNRSARDQLFRRAFLRGPFSQPAQTPLTWDKKLDLITKYGE
jgi:hypothetical protein